MPINLVITNAGRAALINAANTGTLPVTIAQVGVSAVYTPPAATLTALPSELKRLMSIAGMAVADDTLHVTLRDESADEYSLRAIALYLADGTLFACAGQSTAILNKASSAVALAAFDVVFADIAAASLAFGDTDFMMPSATTETQGVVELATLAEAQAGTDPLRVLTPQAARNAVMSWLLAQDGAGSGIDADLLDGQQGSWYANIAARLGYTPVNRAGDVISGSLTVNGSNASGAGLILSDDGDIVDLNDGFASMRFANGVRIYSARSGGLPVISLLTNGQILSGSSPVWHAGNDGSGSGLDADTLDGLHASQIIPSGVILMWSGAIANIPGGWALCNGANGTPDLRNRFIVGAGSDYVVGATGGSDQHNHGITVAGHALTEAQIPAHAHGIVDPGHAHQQRRNDHVGAQATSGGNPDSAYGELEYGLTSTATTGISVSSTGGGQAHSHGASSGVADSRPPYFALAFIMKL